MQNKEKGLLMTSVLAISIAFLGACGTNPSNSTSGSSVDPNETAAKVNGKVITMEAVDRAVKQQAQGQESKLSPLELAGARLQVLQSLVEQEVMFQKAEKEGTVPTEEEITAEINKQKTQSGKSADQIEKDMKEIGMTEAALRETTKKALSNQKLVDKVTGKIEPPKDAEIDAFYNGNKDAFVKKRGVKLAAIVIDPSNGGEGDTTVDEQSAVLKANEIIKKIKAHAELEGNEITLDTELGDLGIHSLELTEIVFDLEEAYGIEIEMDTVEAWNSLKNVGDIVEATRGLIAAKG